MLRFSSCMQIDLHTRSGAEEHNDIWRRSHQNSVSLIYVHSLLVGCSVYAENDMLMK